MNRKSNEEANGLSREEEKKPSGFTANAAGGASDDASEVVDGRKRERVLQMRGRDPLEENLPENAAPSSHPLHPSQTLLLRQRRRRRRFLTHLLLLRELDL